MGGWVVPTTTCVSTDSLSLCPPPPHPTPSLSPSLPSDALIVTSRSVDAYMAAGLAGIRPFAILSDAQLRQRQGEEKQPPPPQGVSSGTGVCVLSSSQPPYEQTPKPPVSGPNVPSLKKGRLLSRCYGNRMNGIHPHTHDRTYHGKPLASRVTLALRAKDTISEASSGSFCFPFSHYPCKLHDATIPPVIPPPSPFALPSIAVRPGIALSLLPLHACVYCQGQPPLRTCARGGRDE